MHPSLRKYNIILSQSHNGQNIVKYVDFFYYLRKIWLGKMHTIQFYIHSVYAQCPLYLQYFNTGLQIFEISPEIPHTVFSYTISELHGADRHFFSMQLKIEQIYNTHIIIYVTY